MIKNYIKTAYRSLWKNKGFTAINVLGLSVGLAACLLIVLYVVDELSYDRYNTNAGRIYRITENVRLNGREGSYGSTEAPLADAVKDLPGIEKIARLIPNTALFMSAQKFSVRKGNENLQEKKVVFAESSLFDMFTLPVIDGSAANALTQPHTAVITESTAKKYFNKTSVVGQTITINDTSAYKITAVIKNVPVQSHFHYDFFLSFSSMPESKVNSWGYGGMRNYLLIKPGANIKNLEAQIKSIELKNSNAPPSTWTSGGNYLNIELKPLLDIHLRSTSQYELEQNGNIQYVYIFSVVALFILLIACVNFMNLSTARSSNRAKEVGVRKVLGSARKYLIAQFLTESVMVTMVSTLIAVFLAILLMPAFNQMAGKQLAITTQTLTWLLPALLVIVLVIGSLAGSYPALFLSAFKPIEVLKGKIASGFKGGLLRSFLVVFQFSISIFLIIGTIVIYNQLNYIHNKNLGFDRSEVLVIKNTGVLGKQAAILKQQLKQLPGVVNATMTAFLPVGEDRNVTGLFPDRTIDIKKDMLSEFWPVDEDYISTMGIKMIDGRNFNKQMATDTAAIIVNEAFVKVYGQKQPLDKTIYRDTYGIQPYHIVGVMKDFNFNSLHDKINPVVLYYSEDRGAISLRVKTGNLTNLMSQIQSKWKELSPNQRFSYSFMDEDFDATYSSEKRIGQIFISFSTLAILISCLGLFGLAAYAAEQRNKEIGIRKVLGASVTSIVGMLSKDFIKLVFVAILIASSLAWLAMNKWLQDFAYRINFQWWILVIAGGAAILIAFATISFQSIKAALSNPVRSLKNE